MASMLTATRYLDLYRKADGIHDWELAGYRPTASG